MARTNYSYGKRLRELAKKQKREEKLQRRKERKEAIAAGETFEVPLLEVNPLMADLAESEEEDSEADD